MKCGSQEEFTVLQWISLQAKQIVGAQKVILFGSRARGDADERSDFDIAIEATHPDKFPELRAILEENPLTLLAFDIVDLATVSQEFRERILREGKEI